MKPQERTAVVGLAAYTVANLCGAFLPTLAGNDGCRRLWSTRRIKNHRGTGAGGNTYSFLSSEQRLLI